MTKRFEVAPLSFEGHFYPFAIRVKRSESGQIVELVAWSVPFSTPERAQEFCDAMNGVLPESDGEA